MTLKVVDVLLAKVREVMLTSASGNCKRIEHVALSKWCINTVMHTVLLYTALFLVNHTSVSGLVQ